MKLRETEICFNWSIYGKKKSDWLPFSFMWLPGSGRYLGPEASAGQTVTERGGREREKRENEVGVSGRSHFLSLKKKKMEVQSREFRLSDHETESAKAEGPGS